MTATSVIASANAPIVITTAIAGIAADTAFTITLSGVTMGAVTAGSNTGITVQTDADTVASAGVASGGIFTQTTAVTFNIAPGDRVAAKTNVPVTLEFKTSAALSTNGKITLNYPAAFFVSTLNPAANAAGSTSVSSMTATSAFSGNSIVISTAVVGIAATTAVTITLSGVTMGAVNAGSNTGITVQTDADTVASAGVASGGILALQITLSPSTSRLDSLYVTLTTLAPNFINGSSQCRIIFNNTETP